MHKRSNPYGVELNLNPTSKVVNSTEDSLKKPKPTSEPPIKKIRGNDMNNLDLCRSIARNDMNKSAFFFETKGYREAMKMPRADNATNVVDDVAGGMATGQGKSPKSAVVTNPVPASVNNGKSIQDMIRRGRYFGGRDLKGWTHSENGIAGKIYTPAYFAGNRRVVGASDAKRVKVTADGKYVDVGRQKNEDKLNSIMDKNKSNFPVDNEKSTGGKEYKKDPVKTPDFINEANGKPSEKANTKAKADKSSKSMNFLKSYGKNMKSEFGNVRKAFGDGWKGDGGTFNQSMKSGFKALWDSPNLRNTSLAVGGGLLAAGIGSMLLRRRRSRRRYDD